MGKTLLPSEGQKPIKIRIFVLHYPLSILCKKADLSLNPLFYAKY
jgi:hypothetical protein